MTQTNLYLVASPPDATPSLYAEGTNFSAAVREMTIFAPLGREVTFLGKYLTANFYFLFFIFFLIPWSSGNGYKTFCYHKVPLDVQLMIFIFFLKKKYFVPDISRFLCFCEIHRFQNLWCQHGSFPYFLNPKYYQNEFGQILVWSKTNISNIFLAQCWRL